MIIEILFKFLSDRAGQGFHFQFSISEEARPTGMRIGYAEWERDSNLAAHLVLQMMNQSPRTMNQISSIIFLWWLRNASAYLLLRPIKSQPRLTTNQHALNIEQTQ